MQGSGRVDEVIWLQGERAARISCEPDLVPLPGQYLLAHDPSSDLPLASALFLSRRLDSGFESAVHVPSAWMPGTRLNLRGPLGKGFALPRSVRRVALIAWENDSRRLLPLMDQALKQDASVTLVCSIPPDGLPLETEVQPLRAAAEVCRWSDYAAVDLACEHVASFAAALGGSPRRIFGGGAQVLVRVPMPCGGLADCGVCAVKGRRTRVLACVDGPVFDSELLDWKSQ